MTTEVIHRPDVGRFELTVDGHTGVADYQTQGDIWVMHHTYVPDQLRGRGVAARLVEAALRAAREAGAKIDPQCSYVARYLERHPETADLRV